MVVAPDSNHRIFNLRFDIQKGLSMSTSKLFSIVGITTHSRENVTVTKVRFGSDMIRLVKMLSSDRKIGVSYDLGGRGDGFLDSKRVDLIELPSEMTKEDALKHLASHEQFQSPADQALIQETLSGRTTAPKTPKTVKMPVSMDAIKARAQAKADSTETQEIAQ
jgi:hypothetical protein